MKTKITKKTLSATILFGSVMLIALPLQAGRGNAGQSGGNGGVCPNGYEPGTRVQQDCTRALDGSGAQLRGKKGTTAQKGGQGPVDGTGSRFGRRNGGRQGTGNPEDCPNYNNNPQG